MKIGLQTSTGGVPIGRETLTTLKASGFQIIRIEAGPDPRAAANEVLESGLTPLVICNTPAQIAVLPSGSHAELGNEPDIASNGWTVTRYREAIRLAVDALPEGVRLWVGVVSNLNIRGLSFLAQIGARDLPADVGVSVHRYPEPGSHTQGHDGLTRDQEVAELKAIVGDRPLAVSEVGYNAIDFTHEQIIAAYQFERDFWWREGFEFAVAYQIASANLEPGDDTETRKLKSYGFREPDGKTWKPAIVEAWTGQPFRTELPPDTPAPPAKRITFAIPVNIREQGLEITGTLQASYTAVAVEEPPPPPQKPTIEIAVLDADAKPILGAKVMDGVIEKTVDTTGSVTFEVDGPRVFRVSADGYEAKDVDLPPGQHRVHLVRTVTPPIPPPTGLNNRVPSGAPRLQKHVIVDDNGAYLSRGFSFFWVPRAFRDHPDRYKANMAYGAAYGFDYYRGFVETGGWPAPDGWEFAGMSSVAQALALLPQYLDDAFTRYRLRCSLTIFDGWHLFPTFERQDAFVRDVCAILKPRLHTIQDVQIANEYGPTRWTDHPEGIGWLKRHARTVRELLGPNVLLSLSAMNAEMDDADEEPAIAEAKALFGGLLGVVNVNVPHYSRDIRKIDGPWRHVRKPWERVLHDKDGTALTPDAAIDDEGMGPRSSVAEETNVSRLVQRAMVGYVSGLSAYTYHSDAGIWSDLLHPAHKKAGKGEHTLITDHPESVKVGEALQRLIAVLPKDLPNWSRTRHGLPLHPFGESFQQRGDGFEQIWPDRVTTHGVVRAYCAIQGEAFVCTLVGIRDRIDLRWSGAMEAKAYACATGKELRQIVRSDRALTLRDSVDTDAVIIGRFL